MVDPDNGLAHVTWQWESASTNVEPAADEESIWTVIEGATTASYTPVSDDDGKYLRASATYIDITSDVDDPDTRNIDERTQKGADPDPVADADPVAKDPELENNPDKLYRVTVVSKNAVRVAPPSEEEDDAPQFSAASFDRTVAENAENGSIVGVPVQVVPELDKDGKPKTTFTYKLDDTITNDHTLFYIESHGQIRVGQDANLDGADQALNYEGVNTFTLIVTATDDNNPSRKAMVEVIISLINLNERPYFDQASRDAVRDADGATDPIGYAEVRTNAVVQLAVAEPDGGSLRWEVTGADASAFTIVDAQDINDGKDRVQLMFSKQPNFEAMGGPENLYNVTVRATEMSPIGVGPAVALAAELKVAVRVDNVDEKGNVELNWLQPEVNTSITATLTDPDTMTDPVVAVESPTWTWYRAKVSNPNRSVGATVLALADEWELIDDANAATYDQTDDYEGLYLLARVEYTDQAGTEGKMAVGISANPVQADVLPADNNSPDFNASTTTREIPENTAVGDPVGDPVDVDRNEDNDILTYEIVTAPTDGNPAPDTEDLAFLLHRQSYWSVDG